MATRIAPRRSSDEARYRVGEARLDRSTSGQSRVLPEDDDDERIAALNALMQMDSERAMPILKKVLERRDPCSYVLRRKAVWLISQKGR